MPSGWQRGLLWIPALYLAFMGVLVYGHSLKEKARFAGHLMEWALVDGKKAHQRQDLKLARQADEQLNRAIEKLRTIERSGWILAGGTGLGFLLFAWSTWQVTQQPISRWETFARWGVLLVPALTGLKVMAGRHAGVDFASQILSIVVSVGHHHALHKIAAWAGDREVQARIDWLYRTFYRIVFALFVLALSGVLKPVPSWVIEWLFLTIGGLCVTGLAFTIWQLRTTLLAIESEWTASI